MLGRPTDTALASEVARDVCVRLNNQAVLNGTIANRGGGYLVTLAAVECSSGEKLVETRATANGQDSVLKAVDAVSADMRGRLGEKLRDGKQIADLQIVPTTSLKALRLYTDAHWQHAANKCAQAIPLYERAVALDPKFAIAWGGLGNCYNRVQRPVDARVATQKAYDLRESADAQYRFWIVNAYNARVIGNLGKP
jgi:eukaryotic-like serine/threonine-protein kinase